MKDVNNLVAEIRPCRTFSTSKMTPVISRTVSLTVSTSQTCRVSSVHGRSRNVLSGRLQVTDGTVRLAALHTKLGSGAGVTTDPATIGIASTTPRPAKLRAPVSFADTSPSSYEGSRSTLVGIGTRGQFPRDMDAPSHVRVPAELLACPIETGLEHGRLVRRVMTRLRGSPAS